MASITLAVNGAIWGTGSYNPVPGTISPVAGSISLVAVINDVVTPLLTLGNLTVSWGSNVITAAGNGFNFSESVNLPGTVTNLAPLGIPNTGEAGFTLPNCLLTKITTASGTLNVLTF